MPNENWVGFAKSPKPNPDLSPLQVESKVEFVSSADKVFRLVTSAEGLSSWLHKTEESEVRTSGKIQFADVAEEFQVGVFSHVELGRRVVINSELFGELLIAFEKRSPVLVISFTKLVGPESRDQEQKLFDSLILNLRNKVGELA
jgi:hypothetical protein